MRADGKHISLWKYAVVFKGIVIITNLSQTEALAYIRYALDETDDRYLAVRQTELIEKGLL